MVLGLAASKTFADARNFCHAIAVELTHIFFPQE